MVVFHKPPSNFVFNLTPVSIHVELSMFLEIGRSNEAVHTNLKVLVARGVIAVIILPQWDVPGLKNFYPVSPMWGCMSLGFNIGFPVTW